MGRCAAMEVAATTIDLLRHGSPEISGLFCAPGNTELSEAGMAAMQRVTVGESWQRIYSSPALRCQRFAEQLSTHRHTELTVEAAWREFEFGDWVGLTNEQVWQQYPQALETLWSKPLAFNAPGGDSMVVFVERVKQQWHSLIADNDGRHILLITHAGVIRVILSLVLDIAYENSLRLEIDYAQRSRIKVYDDGNASLEYHGLSR